MFTSLKVVSMAVSFLTDTNRLAMVFRNAESFCLRSLRSPLLAGADPSVTAGLVVSAGAALDA